MGRRRAELRCKGAAVAEDLLRPGRLDDFSQVHHRHAVGDMLDHAQVVGDEEVRQLELGLQVLQEIDDLGLDGHVQRRDRLVAHDQLGVSASARAMRCAGAALRRIRAGSACHKRLHSDGLEQMRHALRDLLAVGDPMDEQRLADDLSDRPCAG